MITSYTIEEVLKAHDMVGYLASRGIEPDLVVRDRAKYKCPLHEDDTPSFYIYAATERAPHGHFYCYGCKAGGNVIHLKAKLEDISYGAAISKLAHNLNIDASDELDYLVAQIQEQQVIFKQFSPDELLFLISKQLHNFLIQVSFEEPYFSRAEKVMMLADRAVYRCDLERVKEIRDNLTEHLEEQLQKYTEQKEADNRDTMLIYSKIV